MSTAVPVAVLLAFLLPAQPTHAQAGYPDSLRRYCDSGTASFRIGTSVNLRGSGTGPHPNGYQPGLLPTSERDAVYQALIAGQFNQIEPENELKMMNVWTGGVALVNGHYAAQTNLFDASGPLNQLCAWAERQRKPLAVRGHCMVYDQNYTLPTFPNGQAQLFNAGARNDTRRRMAPYTAGDVRDMLESYVRQVVDATLAQNARSRALYGYKVVQAWDVTNEVIDRVDNATSPLGFAYRPDDPWYVNGPITANASTGGSGYDYVVDLYRWADDEMRRDVGKTIAGQTISTDDRFLLYYNEFGQEYSAERMAHCLSLIDHVRSVGGRVDGLGFQLHIRADGLNQPLLDSGIHQAIRDHLRFSVTELDCTVRWFKPSAQFLPQAKLEASQGIEFGQVARLCRESQDCCDCLQLWGATDDGSWIPNGEATPITRWVADSRPGPTHGKFGYWPKEGQLDPETACDPATGKLDPTSGHRISSAYDALLAALKLPQ